MMSLMQSHLVHPRMHERAKKRVRCDATKDDREVEKKKGGKEKHPLKKAIMKFFKIEEIDYEKLRREHKWAIRKDEKKGKKLSLGSI